MMDIITLTHEDLIPTPSICMIHNGWPVHSVDDHELLKDIRPFSEDLRCSVCDLEWGRGAVSQHESCRTIMSDGNVRYAYPRSLWQRGDNVVEIEYTDPYA